MSPPPPLLAANAADVIQVILILLFIVVPVVLRIISSLAQNARQQPQPRVGQPPRPPAPARPPAGQQPPRAGAGGLPDEIDEFLRRAAQRRQGPAPAGRPPAPAPPAARPANVQVPVRVAPAPQPVVAEIVGRRPSLGEGVKQHVGQHLDTAEFQRRAAELGIEVSQIDQETERRLRAKFAHELGQLAAAGSGESTRPTRADDPTQPQALVADLPSTVAGLVTMLGTPEGICRAIILNEIFTRPEDRWT